MRKQQLRLFVLALLIGIFTSTAAGGEERRLFYAYDASNGMADNSSQIVYATSSGRIIVTTLGHVNFFDGAGFTHIDPQSENIYPLPGYKGRYQIYIDHFDHLWIKAEGLMSCVNLATERFICDIPAVFKELGVVKPVDDIFGDGEGHVWFRSGHELYNPHLKKSFNIQHSSQIMDVDLMENRLLLTFHADGAVVVSDYASQKMLYRDNPFTDDEHPLHVIASEICLVGHQYFQVLYGEQGSVFMRYDVDKREWKTLLKSPLRMNTVYPFADKIYVGTERGYLVHDIASEETEHIEKLMLTKGRTQVANINSLCFDTQGGMWIATEQRGLLYAKPLRNPFYVYNWNTPEFAYYTQLLNEAQPAKQQPLPRKVNCVLTDSRGWKWTGSYNGLLLEMTNGERRVFTTKDGLPNLTVHSLVEDNANNIWVTTSFGIVQLIIRDGAVAHLEPYINQDNIPNESFMNGRALELPDGRIVMQSIDHMVVFDPMTFLNDKLAAVKISPKLIRLAVIGYDIEAGKELDGKVITEKAVACTDVINVNYNQNSVALHFSGFNYMRPVQTYYRVRIKGVPGYDKWRILSYGKSEGMVDKNGQLHLPLLGLNPGSYKVEMQASLWPDSWTEDPVVWTINVEQPWWRTTGLYVALTILIGLLLLLNFTLFYRNTHWRMIRNNEEADIRRNIRSFASRCESLSTEIVTPQSMPKSEEGQSHMRMNDIFVRTMLRIVPFVQQQKDQAFTMEQLAEVAEVNTSDLYKLFSAHLDLNPRIIMMPLRLQEAAQQLTNTQLSIDEVAKKCRFSSTNFFIASFFHYYRQTPEAYRSTMPR